MKANDRILKIKLFYIGPLIRRFPQKAVTKAIKLLIYLICPAKTNSTIWNKKKISISLSPYQFLILLFFIGDIFRRHLLTIYFIRKKTKIQKKNPSRNSTSFFHWPVKKEKILSFHPLYLFLEQLSMFSNRKRDEIRKENKNTVTIQRHACIYVGVFL